MSNTTWWETIYIYFLVLAINANKFRYFLINIINVFLPIQLWINLSTKEFRYINPLYSNTINTNIYIIDDFVSWGKYHVMSFQNIQWQFVATIPFLNVFKILVDFITNFFTVLSCDEYICIWINLYFWNLFENILNWLPILLHDYSTGLPQKHFELSPRRQWKWVYMTSRD